jgi:hypothetical protein
VVTEIRIYVEGGGDRADTKALIREGFGKFLAPLRQLARERRIKWTVTVCGRRDAAFDNFKTAQETHPEAFLVLLVDSETPVVGGRWEHLQRQDGWESGGLVDEHCHLMVRTVEAWLIADPEALAGYYGQHFNRKALPTHKDIEAVSKEQLLDKLKRATEKTQKGPYAKIRHCADLLGRLNPDRVRQRARHCELLFSSLESLLREA